MFFATLWAFLIGKNAIENGVKNAKLNSWSKQNTYDPTTNTYIDAKGFTKDATSGAVRNIYRTKDGRLIGKGIFGNDIVDYTYVQQQSKIEEAKKHQDQFHTVVKIIHGGRERFQDLKDSSKIYEIQEIFIRRIKGRSIPVYVDIETSKIVRPIDEYMEFISHDEYYNRIKVRGGSNFIIRDINIINEMIKQRNSTITSRKYEDNWDIRHDLNEYNDWIKMERRLCEHYINKKIKDKTKRALERRTSASGKAWLI